MSSAQPGTLVGALILLGLLTPVWGQALPIPDAGSLQRETGRGLQAPSPAPLVVSPMAPAQAQDPNAPRVTVVRFAIEGAELIPEAQLQGLLADMLGQALSMAELELAVERIERVYREAGWYARAWLPAQDVTEGLVRIQVLEGRFGEARLQSAGQGTGSRDNRRANAQAVLQTVTARLQPGQPLSAADLERGLLLANDLPGIEANAILQAGQSVGSSDLAVAVQDTALVSGDIGFSNHGLRPTGKGQLTGGLALNDLSGHGDQLALRMLGAAHLGSVLARYSLPLGHDGLRLAAWGSAMRYSLAGNYSSLEAKGTAYTAGVGVSYPLLRQQERNLRLEAGLQQRRYNDDMLQTAVRRHRTHVLNLGLGGDWVDSLGGGASNWAAVQLIHGQLSMRDVDGDVALDAAGPRTQGRYTKLALQWGRVQSLDSWLAPMANSVLGRGWQVQAAASGQTADKNLGSAERMTLGGPDQVRAYPVNEASGDAGLLIKLQLQRQWASGWQAQLFYDWGHIRQHKNLWVGWDGGTGLSNSYHLAGWGLGLGWLGQGSLRGWQVNASIATPVGSNPGSAMGRNSDGSSQRSARGWLSVSRSF